MAAFMDVNTGMLGAKPAESANSEENPASAPEDTGFRIRDRARFPDLFNAPISSSTKRGETAQVATHPGAAGKTDSGGQDAGRGQPDAQVDRPLHVRGHLGRVAERGRDARGFGAQDARAFKEYAHGHPRRSERG